MTKPDVLISVAERFVAAFRAGTKTAEVRRRRLNVPPDTRIWIYSKMPTGRVELVGRIEDVVAAPPASLWKKYGTRTGISRAEFFGYLTGCKVAYIILVADFKALAKMPTLRELRRSKRGFHPPQFAKMIESDGALHRALSSAVAV